MPSRHPTAQDPLPPHLDPRGRHRTAFAGDATGTHWRTGAARLTLSVFALLSVALLVLAGYAWYTYRDINNGVPRVAVGAIDAKPSGAPVYNGQDVNILLVGNDDRTNMTNAEVRQLHVGRDGGSMATDTMMIVHVPADGKRAVLISLPRDSWVDIAGYGHNRLNSAYVDGYNAATGSIDDKRAAGANLLISTVSNLTGLTINHYVQVSLLGFYRLSEALGGVPVNLCHAVDDTVAANGGDGGSGLVLSAGPHVIKGVQALEFVRQRHGLPNGDLDRVRRQQYFLTAAFREVESAGVITKLHALDSAIKSSLVLDPSLNLLDLARQLESLSANNIAGKTIPTTPETIDGMDVLGVDQAKVRSFVERAINPPAPTPAGSTSASPTISKSPTSPAPSSSAPIDSACIN